MKMKRQMMWKQSNSFQWRPKRLVELFGPKDTNTPSPSRAVMVTAGLSSRLENSSAQRNPQERSRMMYYRKENLDGLKITAWGKVRAKTSILGLNMKWAVSAETQQSFSLLKKIKNKKGMKIQVSRCVNVTETYCCETCKTWIFRWYCHLCLLFF